MLATRNFIAGSGRIHRLALLSRQSGQEGLIERLSQIVLVRAGSTFDSGVSGFLVELLLRGLRGRSHHVRGCEGP